MRPLPNTPGGQYSRFTRIARDLARLPVELIEPVLSPLPLEAVARLALHDAPPSGLTWAIEHSPTWSPWFAHHRAELAALVAVTDQLAALRLPPTATKDARDWQLCTHFLQAHAGPLRRGTYAGAPWKRGRLGSGALLAARWAGACRAEARSLADCVAAEEHARFAEFLDGDADAYLGLLEALRGRGDGDEDGVAIEDVRRFVGLLHRAREARAMALAGQLRRLAALYERHPTRVKQPFAPQTRRVNEGHVLEKMRIDVKRMEECFPLRYQRRPAWYRFRHGFPNLIPYDWCLRLFVRTLDEHPLPEEGGTTVYPAGFVAAIQKAIEGFPYFYDVSGGTMDPTLVESLRTVNTRWSADLQNFPAVSKSKLPQVDDAKPGFLTRRVGRNYLPHSDAELDWLEAFIEIVAWMEQRFPEFVSEVRGKDWDEGNEEERKKRKDKRNART